MVKSLNLYEIQEWIYEAMELASDVEYFEAKDSNLLNALDGDDDEANEFRLAFSQLSGDLQRFLDDIQDECVSEYFDLFFPAIGAGGAFGGYLGYDEYEEDYFGIEPYEYAWAEDEASKAILRLTKKDILQAAGSCLKVAANYMSVKYRYDCLETSLRILQGNNLETLKMLDALNHQYDEAEGVSKGFEYGWKPEVRIYEKMLEEIPQEFWVM